MNIEAQKMVTEYSYRVAALEGVLKGIMDDDTMDTLFDADHKARLKWVEDSIQVIKKGAQECVAEHYKFPLNKAMLVADVNILIPFNTVPANN